MKLAVVGSRSFNDYEFMKRILQHYPCSCIVSGGAKGADRLAKRYAAENGIPIKEFLPNWNNLGKKAGFIRNRNIIEASDEVVAFWNGISRGTMHTIKLAEEMNKPVYRYWPSGDEDIENIGI